MEHATGPGDLWRREDPEFRAVVRRVERGRRAAARVRTLGAAWLAVGTLGTLAAGTVFLALAPWGWLSGDPTATWVLGTLGTALALAALALAVPALAVGAGLRRGRPWARALALAVGVLLLPWVPIGTALGVATLVVLLDDASRAAFGDAPAGRQGSGA